MSTRTYTEADIVSVDTDPTTGRIDNISIDGGWSFDLLYSNRHDVTVIMLLIPATGNEADFPNDFQHVFVDYFYGDTKEMDFMPLISNFLATYSGSTELTKIQ